MSRPTSDAGDAGHAGHAGHWSWERAEGEAGIERLAEEWNALAHAGPFTPAADALWTGCAWRAFGSGALVLHALRCDGRLAAVLPMQRTGRWARTWTDFQNIRVTPFWSFAADAARLEEVADRALGHLLEDAQAVRLRRLHEGGPLERALRAAAARRGLAVDCEPNGADAFLELPPDWKSFRSGLSSKLRKNTERAVRQLEGLGELRFDVVDGGQDLDARLDECFELEALGWKASDGETILSRQDWGRFYRELPRRQAAAGRLALYTLRLDGALLAYDLCLRAQGRINLLKISYHPEYGRYSPSNVLRYRVFEHEIERGEVRVYHFGDPSDWKLRWTDGVAPLVALRVAGRGARAGLARLEERARARLRARRRGASS